MQEIQSSNPDITEWKGVDCLFRNENSQTLRFRITKYEEDYDISSIVFEKDGQQVTEYIGGDKLFYIMSNNSRKTATWSDGQLVVSINGEFSQDIMKTMIDSIGG